MGDAIRSTAPIDSSVLRHFVRTARRVGIRVATRALVLAVALAATRCGDSDSGSTGAARPTTPSPASTGPGPTTTTTSPGPSATTTTGPGTPTMPATTLGPEWVQHDGRVLIEAVASGDPQNLLSDLVALGLVDGVVVGRLVNGWLPIESFEAAKRLGTLQFVQPTGAGTG